MPGRAHSVFGLTLGFSLLVAWPANAEKIDALFYSLQQVQDRIAAGDGQALPLQKHLMKLLDGGIREAGDTMRLSSTEFETLLKFAIVGHGTSAVVEALQEVPKDDKRADLTKAVIDYRLRRRNQAIKRFAKAEAGEISEGLLPFVSFAKGNLLARSAPRQAVTQYNLTRLAAPGTLLEEATLRRLLALYAKLKNGKKFMKVANQYARRFIESPYRRQYLAVLQKGIISMRRGISLDKIGELSSLMPKNYAVAFNMYLAREGLLSGHIKLASYSVKQVVDMTTKPDGPRKNPDKLALYDLVSRVASGDPAILAREIAELDSKNFEEDDLLLQKAALGVLSSIVAPIDPTATNAVDEQDKEDTEKDPDKVEDEATSLAQRQASMESMKKDEANIGAFIDETQMRLKEIDKMLDDKNAE